MYYVSLFQYKASLQVFDIIPIWIHVSIIVLVTVKDIFFVW